MEVSRSSGGKQEAWLQQVFLERLKKSPFGQESCSETQWQRIAGLLGHSDDLWWRVQEKVIEVSKWIRFSFLMMCIAFVYLPAWSGWLSSSIQSCSAVERALSAQYSPSSSDRQTTCVMWCMVINANIFYNYHYYYYDRDIHVYKCGLSFCQLPKT